MYEGMSIGEGVVFWGGEGGAAAPPRMHFPPAAENADSGAAVWLLRYHLCPHCQSMKSVNITSIPIIASGVLTNAARASLFDR